ncbi:permease-like cell division protein FtsX [Cryptosporangium phraense]|uniref:Cell division protein FtsX n=1 Tax=Cryptosporangium phraense TaxID=2593070 RepID=A0A545ANP6_9ACTN|nr:permease-like cell division protein FtsX [Cryptosporangium phraense]TQS42871.1 ABC transporter permease [Cryptosporangium phraense]
MRAKFVLTEAATGLWRNVTMTIALILTTAISLALLGAGGLLYAGVAKTKDLLYAQVEVSIFLDAAVTADQKTALQTKLQDDPEVQKVTFESKDEAYKRFKELFKDSPDLVENTKPESLPESFRVKLKNPNQANTVDAEYKGQPGVDVVSTQEELVGRLFDAIDAVKNTSLAVSLFAGLAALLLIGNTIQVAAYSRRREVSIMKLVGASNWYVRLPFILEAAVAGLIGAIFATVFLSIAKVTVIDGALSALGQDTVVPTIGWSAILLVTAPLLMLVSVLTAGITGWVTLRFYVKV